MTARDLQASAKVDNWCFLLHISMDLGGVYMYTMFVSTLLASHCVSLNTHTDGQKTLMI